MFIQVFQGHCRDADQVRAVGDEWVDTLSPGAEGWQGGTYGVTDAGVFVAVVRFESRAAAEQNAARPEQGEWWARMEAQFDGPITFHDSDDVTVFLDGGSDDAGFVQLIQGRFEDPAPFRALVSQPMDELARARPEIIGGTVAIAADGWFTQTMAFRSEQEARTGEAGEMPAERRQEYEAVMSQVQDLAYLDLRHPWFSSPRAD
jgi:hypothetical protein